MKTTRQGGPLYGRAMASIGIKMKRNLEQRSHERYAIKEPPGGSGGEFWERRNAYDIVGRRPRTARMLRASSITTSASGDA